MPQKETKKLRKGRTGKGMSADKFMDFEQHRLYQNKYHHEQRWVFAGDKNQNGTISGNFNFATVTIKTETGEICDISVEAKPEGNLPGIGDYYRIVPFKNSSHCSEDKAEEFVESSILHLQDQLHERLRKLSSKQIFYAFDIEKGGKNEHLFFEHQQDRNKIYLLEEFKSTRNNKFY